jgi:hypothetical protein
MQAASELEQPTGSVMAGAGLVASLMLFLPCHSSALMVRVGCSAGMTVAVGVLAAAREPPPNRGGIVSCSCTLLTRSDSCAASRLLAAAMVTATTRGAMGATGAVRTRRQTV